MKVIAVIQRPSVVLFHNNTVLPTHLYKCKQCIDPDLQEKAVWGSK